MTNHRRDKKESVNLTVMNSTKAHAGQVEVPYLHISLSKFIEEEMIQSLRNINTFAAFHKCNRQNLTLKKRSRKEKCCSYSSSLEVVNARN